MTVALLAFSVALILFGAWETVAVHTWRLSWAAAAPPLPWIVPAPPPLPYAAEVPGWVYTVAAWGAPRPALMIDLLAWWDRVLDRVWDVELDLTITELVPCGIAYQGRHHPWRTDETGQIAARTRSRPAWAHWPTASYPTLEAAEHATTSGVFAGMAPVVSDRCWLELTAPRTRWDPYQRSWVDTRLEPQLRRIPLLHMVWTVTPPSNVDGERVDADHGRWCVVRQRAVRLAAPSVRDAISVPAGAA
jgi:hypothetical protein